VREREREKRTTTTKTTTLQNLKITIDGKIKTVGEGGGA
jgi:hypothetical protein